MKLHEMKKIAQYALDNVLTEIESKQLNNRLKELESEVHFLGKQ